MANPQVEDGGVRIANRLFDALCQVEMSGAEFRVVLAVYRRTYGWRRKQRRIIQSEFANLTGIRDQGYLSRIIKALIERKIITRYGLSEYGPNKNYEQWRDTTPGVDDGASYPTMTERHTQNEPKVSRSNRAQRDDGASYPTMTERHTPLPSDGRDGIELKSMTERHTPRRGSVAKSMTERHTHESKEYDGASSSERDHTLLDVQKGTCSGAAKSDSDCRYCTKPSTNTDLQLWHDLYRKLRGICPTIVTQRDGGTFKALRVSGRSTQDLTAAIPAYLSDVDPWIIKQGYSLQVFAKRIDAYRNGIPKARGSGRNGDVGEDEHAKFIRGLHVERDPDYIAFAEELIRKEEELAASGVEIGGAHLAKRMRALKEKRSGMEEKAWQEHLKKSGG